MKSDNVAKECLLIACVSFFLCVLYVSVYANDLEGMIRRFSNKDYRILGDQDFVLIGCVVAALLSVLLIFGIRKRRASLIAPWLLAAFGGVGFTLFFFGASFMSMPFGQLEFMALGIAGIGVECFILYPLLKLFDDVCRERTITNAEARTK